MRNTRLVFTLVSTFCLTTALTACGGDDGGDGDGDGVDASIDIDEPDANTSGTPDAGTSGSADAMPAMGLGQYCDQENSCPSEAPDCVALTMNAANGFCTLSCGETQPPEGGGDPEPPADGNQICQDAYNGSDGTPGCFLTTQEPNENGVYPWSCAVACGTLQGQDLGGCPGGLECISNLCQ